LPDSRPTESAGDPAARAAPGDATREARLAGAVRAACIEAARTAWQAAGVSGLCADGRFESALGAMQQLDIEALIRRAARPGD